MLFRDGKLFPFLWTGQQKFDFTQYSTQHAQLSKLMEEKVSVNSILIKRNIIITVHFPMLDQLLVDAFLPVQEVYFQLTQDRET